MALINIKKYVSNSRNDSSKKGKNTTETSPEYDNKLVSSLHDDHRQIIKLYNLILTSAKNKDYTNVQCLLVDFATSLAHHLQIEDKQLYGFLKLLAGKKSKLEHKIIADFSSEMKDIAISVFSSINQSPNIPVNDANVDDFIEEFSEIGLILQDRMQREENILYPIYETGSTDKALL